MYTCRHLLPAALAAVLLQPTIAHGAPVQWTLLDGAYFEGGGSLTGSFIYDSELQQILAVNLVSGVGVTTGGNPAGPDLSLLGGAIYDGSLPSALSYFDDAVTLESISFFGRTVLEPAVITSLTVRWNPFAEALGVPVGLFESASAETLCWPGTFALPGIPDCGAAHPVYTEGYRWGPYNAYLVPTPVPVPPVGWLLVAGAGTLGWLRHRRQPAA